MEQEAGCQAATVAAREHIEGVGVQLFRSVSKCRGRDSGELARIVLIPTTTVD